MEIPAVAPGYMICPYDKLHHVRKHRMPIHLKRCEKQHPEIVLALCPYNSVHRMNPKDAKKHEDICPDRHCFMGLENDKPVPLPVGVLPVPVESRQIDSSQHYWDDEITIGNTLDAVKQSAKVKSVYLTHNLTGSKAEKKKKKNEERLRYCQTKDANENERKASIKKQGSKEETLRKLELMSLDEGNVTVEK